MSTKDRLSILLTGAVLVLASALAACSGETATGGMDQAADSDSATLDGVLRNVRNWGPKSARPGEGFNIQPSGDSAFWVLGTGERQVVLELAGRPLATAVRDDIVTALVPRSLVQTLLAEPGSYELALASPARGLRQRVGDFRVE